MKSVIIDAPDSGGGGTGGTKPGMEEAVGFVGRRRRVRLRENI